MTSVHGILGTFSHTGLIVRDLAAAMHQYRKLFGYTWAEPTENSSSLMTPRGQLPRRVLVTISVQRPRLELIEIIDSTAYDTIAEGMRANHVAYAVGDVDAAVERLEQAGFAQQLSGRDELGPTFSYHLDPGSGIFIEVLDVRLESRISAWTGRAATA